MGVDVREGMGVDVREGMGVDVREGMGVDEREGMNNGVVDMFTSEEEESTQSPKRSTSRVYISPGTPSIKSHGPLTTQRPHILPTTEPAKKSASRSPSHRRTNGSARSQDCTENEPIRMDAATSPRNTGPKKPQTSTTPEGRSQRNKTNRRIPSKQKDPRKQQPASTQQHRADSPKETGRVKARPPEGKCKVDHVAALVRTYRPLQNALSAHSMLLDLARSISYLPI